MTDCSWFGIRYKISEDFYMISAREWEKSEDEIKYIDKMFVFN